MKNEQIISELKAKHGSIQQFAEDHGINRVTIYEAVKGFGSRKARVSIAQALKKDPAELWPDRSDNVKRLDTWEWEQQRKDSRHGRIALVDRC